MTNGERDDRDQRIRELHALGKTDREIGAELGVEYILEGTILWDKSSDTTQIRIIPQLIKVSDESPIWTDTYERALHQIFAIQAEIATSIAGNLDVSGGDLTFTTTSPKKRVYIRLLVPDLFPVGF